MKEADRLLDWAQATSPTTGKPRSTKDLRREVRQSRARLRIASSSPTVQAEPETKNLKKAEQPRSLAQIEQELVRKDAYIAELWKLHVTSGQAHLQRQAYEPRPSNS